MLSCLSLVGSASLTGLVSAEELYTPGTYSAEASGMGPLTVDVTVSEGAIEDLVIDGPDSFFRLSHRVNLAV